MQTAVELTPYRGYVWLQEGQKAIFHLEAFVAQFMSRYKNWQVSRQDRLDVLIQPTYIVVDRQTTAICLHRVKHVP